MSQMIRLAVVNLLRNGSQVEAFDINKCANCQKEKFEHTRDKGTQNRETLTLNMTNYESASLIKAA